MMDGSIGYSLASSEKCQNIVTLRVRRLAACNGTSAYCYNIEDVKFLDELDLNGIDHDSYSL